MTLELRIGLAAAVLGAGSLAGQDPSNCQTEGETTGVVVGAVVSTEGGLVLAGAVVRVEGGDGRIRETKTDEQGAFVVCDVPEGVVTVSAQIGPFESASIEIDVGSGVTGEVEIGIALELNTPVESTGRVVSPVGRLQIRGVLRDRVNESPIAGATVALADGTASDLTDGEGAFALAAPPHDVRLNIDHVAYGSQSVDVALTAGESVVLELRISSRAITVEPITVEVIGRETLRLARAGFYERREWGEKLGLGIFLGPEELKRRAANRVSSVFDGMASLRRLRYCDGNHCLILFTVAGAPSRVVDEIDIDGTRQSLGPQTRVPCPMDLYIDGTPVRLFRWVADGGNRVLKILGSVDDLLHVSELAAVEVYRRVSELPAEFTGATNGCGAIAVWTR